MFVCRNQVLHNTTHSIGTIMRHACICHKIPNLKEIVCIKNSGWLLQLLLVVEYYYTELNLFTSGAL